MKGGEKLEYLLIIPGKLPNLNDYISAERCNKYKGAKLKALSENIVLRCIRQQLKGVHITKPVSMAYIWYEPNRRRDLDNISSFGRKVIQDALVNSGVLENDGWQNIRGFNDEFRVSKDEPRIEVYIFEVE